MFNLVEYLPECLRDVVEMNIIECAVSVQANEIKSAIDTMQKQKFIQTSTGFGLSYWEKEYGIPSNPTLNDKFRREIIIAKIRGTGTTTKELIKQVAQAYSGGEVEVTEIPEEYKFIVKFVSIKGIPPNMDGLTNTINEIKPAHLNFEFSYTYNTWGMVRGLTWNQASLMSWDNLRIYEELPQNLLKNSGWLTDTTGWYVSSGGFILDTTEKLNGCNSMKISRTGLVVDSFKYFRNDYPYLSPCKVGDIFTVSCWVKTDDYTKIDKSFGIGIDVTNAAGTYLRGYSNITFTLTENNIWTKITFTYTVTDIDAVFVRFVFRFYRNGTLWVACPKLEYGDTNDVG